MQQQSVFSWNCVSTFSLAFYMDIESLLRKLTPGLTHGSGNRISFGSGLFGWLPPPALMVMFDSCLLTTISGRCDQIRWICAGFLLAIAFFAKASLSYSIFFQNLYKSFSCLSSNQECCTERSTTDFLYDRDKLYLPPWKIARTFWKPWRLEFFEKIFIIVSGDSFLRSWLSFSRKRLDSI